MKSTTIPRLRASVRAAAGQRERTLWPQALRFGARVALAVAVLAIAWLAVTPNPDAPGLGWDKLDHIAAFFVLAALADLGWPGRERLPWRIALLLGYGCLIELVQALLAYRQGSLLDLSADALGIALWLLSRPALVRASPALRAAVGRRISPAAADAGRNARAGSRGSPGE
jgi:VanZ family protein